MISQILEAAFISGLIGAMMRMATPIIFATLGEILAERSGVLNLGIEGIMLMGAMTGFLVSISTGSLWFGVFMAALVGMALGIKLSFHVFLMIPYLLTIVALVSVSRKASVPGGLLKAYRREEKGS